VRRCRFALCAALAVAAAALGTAAFPQAASAGTSAHEIARAGSATADAAVVTVVLDPAVIDYNHRTVTFTGLVTDVPPGMTAAQDLVGAVVTISGPTGPYQATTGNDGTFTVPAPLALVGQTYQAGVAATDTTTAATSAPVPVTERADQVGVKARLGHATIKYGQTDTVSGIVEYRPTATGAYQPLRGNTVMIARTTPAGQSAIKAVTKADGTFTARIPAQKSAGSWMVSAGGTALLKPAKSKPMTLNVQLATSFKHVEIGLSAFKALSVKACLSVTSPGGSQKSFGSSITLEYASSAKGPWKKLRTIKPTTGIAYCSTGSPIWQVTLAAPVANGYYRLGFGGSSSLQRVTGRAVHRWRRLTKITSFSITPHRVRAMGAVTVKGRLWHHTSSWLPYAGHKVVILFQYRGEWFFYQDEPRTNSRGYFSGRFTVFVTSPWIAQFDGDTTDYASATRRIDLTVTSSAMRSLPRGGLADPRPLR
jgi:hypothetical protein